MKPVVTLFEMYGAGAGYVAPRVAEHLGVPYVAQKFSSDTIEDAEAQRARDESDSAMSRVFRTLGQSGSLLDDRGAQALFAADDKSLVDDNNRTVLRETADGGVLVGRNGAIILADRPGALHVLLTGAAEDRVERAARDDGIDRDRAAKRQVSEDRVRREMSERLYHWNPQDPARYDLVINTSRISPDEAVTIIVDVANLRSTPAGR